MGNVALCGPDDGGEAWRFGNDGRHGRGHGPEAVHQLGEKDGRNQTPDADMTASPLDDGLMHDGTISISCPSCGHAAARRTAFARHAGPNSARPTAALRSQRSWRS